MCIESKAGSRVYGAPQTYTRTIRLSRNGISNFNVHPIFNVRTSADNFYTSSVSYVTIRDTYFDYYIYSNADGLLTPDTNYDGYLVDVSVSGSKFNFSNTGAFSVVLGSNSSVANDVSLSVTNSPFWNNRTFVDYDCATYGYDGMHLWLHGESAHYQTSIGYATDTRYTYASFDVDITLNITVYPYIDSQASSADINNQTNSINKAMQDQTNAINSKIQEGNKIAEETKNTTNNIFKSITDFFGSFFQNLINSVISLFVPSAEEMSGLFNQLNQFFSDRFGFLYAPFDYMIQLMNVFLSSTGSTGLTLPGFSIMGYEVWGDLTYDLASDPLVGTICGYVRTGTGILLAGYFIMFLQNFFKERFGSG